MDTSTNPTNENNTKNKLVLPLVLVCIVALFAIGWIIWREASYRPPASSLVSQEGGDSLKVEKTEPILDDGDRVDQNVKIKPKEATKKSVALSYDNQSYLEVKSWDVKIPITKSVSGLSYKADAQNPQILTFYTKETSCNGGGVFVMRGKAKDWLPGSTTNTAATFENEYENPTFGVGKRLGDYYFVSPPVPGVSCAESDNDQAGYERARASIVRALHNMVPLQ